MAVTAFHWPKSRAGVFANSPEMVSLSQTLFSYVRYD